VLDSFCAILARKLESNCSMWFRIHSIFESLAINKNGKMTSSRSIFQTRVFYRILAKLLPHRHTALHCLFEPVSWCEELWVQQLSECCCTAYAFPYSTMASRAAATTTAHWLRHRWGIQMAAPMATRCSVDAVAQQGLNRNSVVSQAASIRYSAAVVVRGIASATLPKLETKIVKVPTMGDSITEVTHPCRSCVREICDQVSSFY
jgi:hypothetical protein